VHLYLHVPFCARRCSYCDFAIAVRREVPSARYAESVLREWEGWQAHPGWAGSPRLDTIYFGGGTPSLLAPEALARILGRITSDRALAPGAEVTLEANPDDVTPGRAAAWRSLGITRVSLGAQSFDPRVLEWMHRTHRAGQAAEAVTILRAAGIEDLTLDLIFALPDDLERDWEADLDQALALEPGHLSLYGLTVEDHTPLGRWVARGAVRPVNEERYAREFLAADRRLAAAGFEHYEVSNYARPGRRARHNSAYWRRLPFIGLGPSAHSGLAGERRWNIREWTAWEQAIERGEDAVEGSEQLEEEAVRLEQVYLGLRTMEGIPPDWLPTAELAAWREAGWIGDAGPARVALTAEGWLRLDSLVGHLQRVGAAG
jgi:oxygen-independent coproporphyrinogen III oxidase